MSSYFSQMVHERKAVRLTQSGLAEKAGLSVAAIRAVERGQGRVSSLMAMLDALGLELRGRNLIAGPVGKALDVARNRRKLSRRELALALGIDRNTLAAIEAGGGLVSGLEAYGGAVGAGLYIAKLGAARPFWSHAANSSGHHGWETPTALAGILTRAVGGFDLDPCAASHSRRKARIKARVLLTVEDDGLSVPWRGKVFCNPPYGRGLAAWVAKCRAEAASGQAVVVGLLPVRCEVRWWHDHVVGHANIFFLKGALKFGDAKGSAPFASAIVAWGAGPELVARLSEALDEAWHVRAAA